MDNQINENGFTITIPIFVLELLNEAANKGDNEFITDFVNIFIDTYSSYKELQDKTKEIDKVTDITSIDGD